MTMEAALAAKAEGMRRADTHANPDWSKWMLSLVERVATEKKFFTADDVFDLVGDDDPVTHERRAFGPVMIRAAKLGLCQKADKAPWPSRRKSLHASPLSVWESRIHPEGQQHG